MFVRVHVCIQTHIVFFTFFRSASDVRLNAEIGYSMKSKLVGVTEGGLSSGNACLDSAFLI